MKKKWIVLTLLCASLAFSSAGVAAMSRDKTGGEYLSARNSLQTTPERQYVLGQGFTVPPYKFTTSDGDIDAAAILISPTGKATVASTVILDTAGKWTIRYTAITAAGRSYSHEESFIVLNNAYSMKNENSSATYGTYTDYGSNTDGLQVRLAMNDAITFNKIIDLNKLKPTDLLLSAFATPSTQGVADFGRIVFTFTDAEDPSVYMQIMAHRYKNSTTAGIGISYVMANCNGQYPAGQEGERVHKNDGLGTPVPHAFTAQVNAGDDGKENWNGQGRINIAPDSRRIKLYYDKDAFTLFAQNNSAKNKVADFDDAEYFDELWFGFPSNKVRLSVSGDLYEGAMANFCIDEVFGIDLGEELLIDDTAPVITIDVADKDDMPEARVGGSYPIPSATAFDDMSGECKTDVKIYYNNLSEHPIAIASANGRFATDYIGDYGIVYTATDAMGNTAREVLNVHAGNAIPELTVTCPAIPAKELGHEVDLSAPTVSGGSGATTWTATATLGNVTLDATDGFIPETEGEWTVTYTVTDFIGTQKQASCTMTATAGAEPILPEHVSLPLMMIAGASYTMPVAYAKDYSSGTLVESLCDVEIADASGAVLSTVKAGETYKPAADLVGSVKIRYKSGTASTGAYEIPVIQPWGERNQLNTSKYFYGYDGSEGLFTAETSSDNSGMKITSAGTRDFMWTFVNAQTAENSSVVLKSIVGETDCEAFEVYFTDASDVNNTVCVMLERISTGTRVTVCDRTIELRKSLWGDAQATLSVSYASGRVRIETTALDVNRTVSDMPFGGFKSDRVYISVKAVGVTESTSYKVESISGSTFGSLPFDTVAPKVTVLGDVGGTYASGDTYTIAPAAACDTYCPNVSLSLTVRDPDGNVVSDVNGVQLSNVDASKEYKIVFDKLGQYQLAYTAAEIEWKNMLGRPNSGTATFMLNVLDAELPEMVFNGKFADTAAVGDVVSIPGYTVSDNVTAAEDIIVAKFVVNPDGRLIPVSGNSIKCDYAGKYEFRILVSDAAGNTRLYKHAVQVG